MKCYFRIRGIDCASCASDLERAISRIRGVRRASLNFMSEKLVVECDDDMKDEVVRDIERVVRREEPKASIREY